LHFRGNSGNANAQQYYFICTLLTFFLVFVVSFKGLAADRSPIQGILLTYYKQDSETQKIGVLGSHSPRVAQNDKAQGCEGSE